MMRLCILEDANSSDIGAIIHRPEVDVSFFSKSLGISRYDNCVESQ